MARSSVVVLLIAAVAATCGHVREDVAPFEAATSSGSSSGETTIAGEDTSEEAGSSSGEAGSSETDTGPDETTTTTTTGDGDGDPPSLELIELAYGADPAQTLDLYRLQPLSPTPLPTVVLAHGGLWQGGDKSSLAALCEMIVGASAGTLACASINYRLSFALGGVCRGAGIATYLQQLDDFAAAFAHLSGEAESLGLDSTRIYIGGHSAGGHLAHTLNLRWPEFSSACDRFGGCAPAAGAIGFEGIYDIATWDAYDAAFWQGQFACATRRAFGAPPGSPSVCVDDHHQLPCWEVGSPTYLANHAGSLGLAPVGDALMIHSPDDDWVDSAEATGLGAALSSAFPDLGVITIIDGSCGAGSHDGVLYDSALANCIVNFVNSAGDTI